MSTSDPSPARRRRLWPISLAVVALGVVALIAAVPWALGTPRARRWLLGRADRALAPGGLDAASFQFSWWGPTRISGFALRDRQGDRVLSAPTAMWDRNLWQILFDRPRYGTLDLGAGALDLERAADGTIDLYEALRPVLTGNPETDLTVRMTGGTFRLRSPGLSRPVTADHADLRLWIPAAPRPVSWWLALSDARDARHEALAIVGNYDRWQPGPGGRSDLFVRLEGSSWPLELEAAGVVESARLDGTLHLERRTGLWRTSGTIALRDFNAGGPRLAGDRLRIDRLGASWSVAETDEGWAIRQLAVQSPLASLTSSGTRAIPVGQAARFEGRIDLASLAGQLPHALRLPEGRTLRQGSADFHVDVRGDGQRPVLDIAARTSDLVWEPDSASPVKAPLDLSARITPAADGLRIGGRLVLHDPMPAGDAPPARPVTMTVQALYQDASDRVELSKVALDGPFGSVRASGRLDEPSSSRRVDLRGTWDPDWDAINEVLPRRVEPGASVAGGPLEFRVQGPLAFGSAAELWNGLVAEGTIPLLGATVYGMDVGPTTIAARSEAGRIALDPIVTTINGGRLRLDPEVVRDGQGGPVLRLGSGTTIEDAAVNEQVSHQVLAYVAPILEQATRPRGRVSVAIERAEIPLGPEASRRAMVEGEVVFRDVEFVPGPLAAEILSLVGREDATLKLNEPVVLAIADGRVQQHGLAIPLGKLSRIELEGSVDFDRNLDMTASLPITTRMLGNRPLLEDIAAGARVTVPIRGTLAHPRIDRSALGSGMKGLGKELLTRGAIRGASELLFRLTRPRVPDASPSPPADEPRAPRQERHAPRRRGRDI